MNILTLLEIVAAADGDRVALGDRDTGLTYAGLLDLAARTARRLDGGEGTVLYATTASPAFPAALFAAAWTGRPFAPLSYRLAGDPLRRLIAAQAPALLVAGRAVLDLAAEVPGVTGTGPDDLLRTAATMPPTETAAPQDPEAPAVLLHTSGTTGTPKVAVLRHRHLTSYVLESTELLSAAPDEAALVSVPPYHIAGVAGLLTGIYSGRRIVQLPNFEAAEWVRLAREQHVTHAMVVPTMLARIVEVLRADGGGLPALRHLSYGGGRMPRPVIERALELLPGVDFVNGYGLTETTSSIAVLTPQDHRDAVASADPRVRRRLESVGRPLPAVEIEVRDSGGRPVPQGSAGELWVRGPQVSGEYAHASHLEEGGWFRTRDGGWIDEDGYVYVEGRLDDVIVRGGENLSPGEIENALIAHPDVAEAAVFGVPDEQWGEVVAAAVVPRPGARVSAEDLREWVAARLRSSRVPALIDVRDSLPRNEMGKLLRRVLRAHLRPAPRP
ncbi:acyl-CoA synthetase (AMP-forming)/AMP-acid ligase II [Thermocatellispora tengchongensis]|uniref:Acyl-CoA synthetase (AMP-forming)/AMP-acid ligase II n=1 Tax=Thermocatellispora tengchongensis TaxID=1073253 RepID=A0A840PED3_9ACTN|nr:fatty acid--CoA ligase family protein [Thermocatellispora tengchongensis]MBB5139784.1 acyl-CoA synthetase (AMP-forming)/AMP-acid ligase II [Thermocatellispora tengchongensis]